MRCSELLRSYVKDFTGERMRHSNSVMDLLLRYMHVPVFAVSLHAILQPSLLAVEPDESVGLLAFATAFFANTHSTGTYLRIIADLKIWSLRLYTC